MEIFGFWLAFVGVCVCLFVIVVCVRYLIYKAMRRKHRQVTHAPLEVMDWEVHHKYLMGEQGGYIYWWCECPKCHNRPLRNRYTNEDELSPFCPFCGEPLGFDDEGDE